MKNLGFDWLTDEFMLYCRCTQLRKKRCFLMNKPCDYLRKKHILSVKTVVMCFLFLRFGGCASRLDGICGHPGTGVPTILDRILCLFWVQMVTK